MSYQQLAQAVDNLSVANETLIAEAQATQLACDEALDAARKAVIDAQRSAISTVQYPFTFVSGQAQYDVSVISGNPDVTTAGLALWVEGGLEFDFTINSTKKFTLNSPTLYANGAQMRLRVNARFDDLLGNFGGFDAMYAIEQAQREVDFQNHLNNTGLENPVAAGVGGWAVTGIGPLVLKSTHTLAA